MLHTQLTDRENKLIAASTASDDVVLSDNGSQKPIFTGIQSDKCVNFSVVGGGGGGGGVLQT